MNNNKSALLPKFQTFEQNILSGNGFNIYNSCFSTHETGFENFELLENGPIDISIIKRDFSKVYHQKGANLDAPDQHVEITHGENISYCQTGNFYLQYDITTGKDDNTNFDEEAKRMTKNAFAISFKGTRLGTTGESDLEHNKYVGQNSAIMRLITSEVGDLISCFDKNDENIIDNTSSKQILINNHDIVANRGRKRRQLPLDTYLDFVKPLEWLQKISDSTSQEIYRILYILH